MGGRYSLLIWESFFSVESIVFTIIDEIIDIFIEKRLRRTETVRTTEGAFEDAYPCGRILIESRVDGLARVG